MYNINKLLSWRHRPIRHYIKIHHNTHQNMPPHHCIAISSLFHHASSKIMISNATCGIPSHSTHTTGTQTTASLMKRRLSSGSRGHTTQGFPLFVSEEVRSAVNEGRPVVALETAIVTHGMPHPHNIDTAIQLEDTLRQKVRILSRTWPTQTKGQSTQQNLTHSHKMWEYSERDPLRQKVRTLRTWHTQTKGENTQQNVTNSDKRWEYSELDPLRQKVRILSRMWPTQTKGGNIQQNLTHSDKRWEYSAELNRLRQKVRIFSRTRVHAQGTSYKYKQYKYGDWSKWMSYDNMKQTHVSK